MIIKMELSTAGVGFAQAEIEKYAENFVIGIREAINTLTVEGAEIAQSAYGEWDVVAVAMTDDTSGEITVAGDYPLMAEFGAGDMTADPLSMFENAPLTDVSPGSYSLLEGSQEYAKTGKWHFAGEEYTYVFPRRGLHQAKQFIIDNAESVIRQVMNL